jgi:hypothetical protein
VAGGWWVWLVGDTGYMLRVPKGYTLGIRGGLVPTKMEKVLIVMGEDLAARAMTKARRHGLSRSEYIRRLVIDDLGDTPASLPRVEEPAMFELESAPLEEGA